jgi:hypothetical protein
MADPDRLTVQSSIEVSSQGMVCCGQLTYEMGVMARDTVGVKAITEIDDPRKSSRPALVGAVEQRV